MVRVGTATLSAPRCFSASVHAHPWYFGASVHTALGVNSARCIRCLIAYAVHIVLGALGRGGTHLGAVREGTGRSLCQSRDDTLPPVVLLPPLRRSTLCRSPSQRVAQGAPLRIPANTATPGLPSKGAPMCGACGEFGHVREDCPYGDPQYEEAWNQGLVGDAAEQFWAVDQTWPSPAPKREEPLPPSLPEGEEPLSPSLPEGEEPLPPSQPEGEKPPPPSPPGGEEQELPLSPPPEGPGQDAGD
ncbi:UNVERIFIED_CONTAM: hypothetical protein FKN15_035576 [Acipenser sinensis]